MIKKLIVPSAGRACHADGESDPVSSEGVRVNRRSVYVRKWFMLQLMKGGWKTFCETC